VIQRVTIGSLPDNVLVEIFDFYQVPIKNDSHEFPWNWEKLVHVCQRWRYLIFQSPIRLNLQLFCTEKSPVMNLLDVWPAFPLAIKADYNNLDLLWPKSESDHLDSERDKFLDNLMAALGRCDRVRQIDIANLPGFLSEEIVTAMQVPFPALRSLSLQSDQVSIFPLPDTFLNGSAPCLRDLTLEGISYPSLPRLLSSTTDLTSLLLVGFPNSASGYIPPEIMATCLSALPKLETFVISFVSPPPRPQQRIWPPTWFVLPALTVLDFRGPSEYLELLAARIDAPLLNEFQINFFHQPVFDIPQTIRFFGHLDSFRPSCLTLVFSLFLSASISFPSESRYFPYPSSWKITCPWQSLDQQVISVAQICSQILPFRSSVKSLNIEFYSPIDILPVEETDPTLWSQLFDSFPSVQRLEISSMLELSVAAALQGLTGESSGEAFPSLCNLFIVGDMSDRDETAQQRIQSFVAARQQDGRPIAVFRHLRTL
jgi:hypothetical protein